MDQLVIWFATVSGWCQQSIFRFHRAPGSPQQSSHAVASGQASQVTAPPEQQLEAANAGEMSHATDSAKSSEWYLERANKCVERAQKMTSESVPIKGMNHNQCKYLAQELKMAIEESRKSFHGSSTEHQGECLEILKLLHRLATEIERFIQDCSKDKSWIETAIASVSVPTRVSSWRYHLELCTLLLRNSNKLGAAWLTWKQLKRFSKDKSGLVLEKASWDKKTSLSNLKSLSPERQVAIILLEKMGGLSPMDTPKFSIDLSREASLQRKEAIGKGPTSTLYRGMWAGEQVAIKTYHDANVPFFVEEVSQLACLCHPNIVNVLGYAINKREGNNSMVMELMDGDLASEMLSRLQGQGKEHGNGSGAPFTILEAVGLILQVAEAVNYLHQHNILHEDLKSHNILVKRLKSTETETELLCIKLGDFNISNQGDEITLIQPKANKDTSRWMAPELMAPGLMSARSFDKEGVFKGDIYSFAMVCYEILTGFQPFTGLKLDEVEENVLAGHRPKLPDSCPPDLKSLIEKCWSSKPSVRPPLVDICEELKFIKCSLLLEPLPQIQREPQVQQNATLDLPSDHKLSQMKVDYSCLQRGMQLGKGGSETIVYSTTWHHNGVEDCVAQKLFFGGMREDFRMEVIILADLTQNPNIACLLCYAIDNHSCSIVMEKMDIDLFELIRQRNLEHRNQMGPEISKLEAQSSKLEAQNSQLNSQSSKLKAQISNLKAQGSQLEVQNSKLLEVQNLKLKELELEVSKLKKQISQLRRTPPFPLHVAVNIMLQIAQGMDCVHRRNIVHRDVKSSNILITKAETNGQEFHVKVADFGLSQIIPKPSSECLWEPFNTGTLKWMAPEVMKVRNVPTSTYDPFKGDIYSFAIVCFEILTGEVPTFKETKQTILSAKVTLTGVAILLALLRGYKFKSEGQTSSKLAEGLLPLPLFKKKDPSERLAGDTLPFSLKLLLNLDPSKFKFQFGVREKNLDPNEELMRSVLAGLRPPLPEEPNCPCRLKALIESCWDQDAGARPSFAELIVELKDVLLDSMQK